MLWAVAAGLLIAFGPGPAHPQPSGPTAADAGRPSGRPAVFEPNVGQVDPRVRFLSRARGYTLYLTDTEAVLALNGGPGDGTVLRMSLVGAQRSPRVTGVGKLPGIVNYFIGDDPARWRTNIPTYSGVKYAGVYPGVDVVYYGRDGQLEYDFVVAPGADPRALTLAFEGPDKLDVDAQGNLVLRTAAGELRLRKPLVYQEVDGTRKPVAGAYVLKSRDRVGFQVAAYDTGKPLVIDPGLEYASYLGGSRDDRGLGIAVDAAGNVYVTGSTSSPNFRTTVGAHDRKLGGHTDAFVTKLDAAGHLVYSTYLGGGGPDAGHAIAVDALGNVFVTGETQSADFPVTTGAFDGSNNGATDVFVTKLSPSGSVPVYSTLLGGTGSEVGRGLALDGFGNAYVTGETDSSDFPVTLGAFRTALAGASDAFVTKLDPFGSALQYSTFLGGSLADSGRAVAIHCTSPDDPDSCNAYVAGATDSPDFPTTAGSFQPTPGGGTDAFVAKLNADGSGLAYSTFLGGSGADEALGIAVDLLGSAYATGGTTSSDFPGPPTQLGSGGAGDVFVAKLSPAGSALAYSTLLGGASSDTGRAIAVDGAGKAYVTGETASAPPAGFPVTAGAFQTAPAGAFDAFVATLDAAGSALAYSTLLGGSGDDVGRSLALDGVSGVWVTGHTSSSNAPFPTTPGAFQSGLAGGLDAFVARLDLNQPPVAVGDAYGIDEDSVLVVPAPGVLANDTDADGDALAAVLVGGPSHGVLALGADGSFTYTPNPNFNGADSFTYRASDGAAGSNVVTVSIAVAPVNDAPTVAVPVADLSVSEDAPDSVLDLSGTFADVDVATNGDGLTLSVVGNSNPALVTTALVGTTLSLDYQPNQHGSATITVRATDSSGAFVEDTFVVTVTPVDDAPTVAVPIADLTVAEDALPTALNLSGTFADADGDALILSIVGNTNPALVGPSLVATGLTLTYQPNANGVASITVRATDSTGAFVEDTFVVTVTPVNDAPAVAAPIADLTVAEDAPPTALNLSGTFADVDIATNGDALTLGVASSNTSLVVPTLAGTTLTLAYQPNAQGVATITVRATDSAGAFVEDAFGVTVTSVNDPPVLAVLDQTVDEGQPLQFVIGVTDPDGDALILSATGLPPGATFDPTTRAFSWTPNAAQAGTYLVSFTASDGQASDTERIVITVNDTILDSDLDTVPDAVDKCPFVPNPDQSDLDGDGLGDVCDPDPNAFQALVQATVADVSAPFSSSGHVVGESVLVTVEVTFHPRSDTLGCYFNVRPSPYNVILRVLDRAGNVVIAQRVPEGPPLVITFPGGDLGEICATAQPFTTAIEVTDWHTLAPGVYTIETNYESHGVKDPDLGPTGICLTGANNCFTPIWQGTAPAALTIAIGDQCPDSGGAYGEGAGGSGCAFADKIRVTSKFTRAPIPGVQVRVFDRNSAEFRAVAGSKNPNSSLYGTIFEADAGRVGTCVTDVDGVCFAGEERKGDYLVIIKGRDSTGQVVYDGKPSAPKDFDAATGVASKEFQIP